jgi:SAM-dependent methyltransferase
MKPNDNIKMAWEVRSLHYGKKPEGVLPKSLPIEVNNYLDNWMYQQIESQVNSLPTKNVKVLDLGCGYGRLSKRILDHFPDSSTYGIDVASHYVELYNKDLNPRGKAKVGDIKTLQFKDEFFDVVFIATTLMYLTNQPDQKKAMKELFRVLKPGGKFVIIERNPYGHKIMTLGGLVTLLRGKTKSEIQSVSFTPGYLSELIQGCEGKDLKKTGIPLLTFTVLLLVLLNFIFRPLIKPILKVISFLDHLLAGVVTPSLYISYVGEKRK